MPRKLIKKKKGVSPFSIRGRIAGRAAGYHQGWNYGYHVGQCDAALGRETSGEVLIRDKKVIYVSAGIDVPYPALDQAIIDGVYGLINEVTVVNPSDNVTALAEKVKPDLVLVLNGVVFPTEQIDAIREKGIKTAVWFTDDPYYTDWTKSIAPHYDYVFTLELSCVDLYRKLGCAQVHYLPFAADSKVFKPKSVDYSYHSDICFIGTAFWNRVDLIDSIAEYLAKKKVIISGWWWDRLKNYKNLSGKIRLGEWMTAEETASYYNGAKIVINLHRQIDDDSINFNSEKIPGLSLNPRSFEIAGCGTLQLTDIRQELGHFYIPGKEIATYSSSDELIRQIEYYLNHEQERKEMALSALIRTRNDHTYQHRLTYILNKVFEL